uniref:Uncharacterized protein n=1 Tax=Myotis myotis TaxID=51298 RepID=A0A7J7SC87_MYOMY|nr:hypothetical protein mMyoMyo1_009524 [Myotis myotis]
MIKCLCNTRGPVHKNLCTGGGGGGRALSPACALSQSGTPREITTCWLRPAPGWQRAGPIPRCSPWSGSEQGRLGSWGAAQSCTEQGRLGGCDATLSHAQGRADWGVGAPSPVTLKAGSMGRLRRHPVTHRAGPIRGLGHLPLSPTEQGRSGGWGATTLTLRAGPMGRLWLYPITHRAGPVCVGGVLGSSPLSGTEQGCSGGLGAAPCHADPGAGRHIILLLYRVEAWCMGGAGWLP